VTRLRATRPGRVAVELDGAPWRTLPVDVVVRTGLQIGEELERPRLRLLRRELRRHEALAAAQRALRHRDHAAMELEARLERAGATGRERRAALETLERAGYVDDARFARGRARALAERGWGDAAIEAELETRGVVPEVAAAVLAELDPERERALRIVEERGAAPRTIRWLAARGFDPEALDGLIANEGPSALR